MFVGRYEENRNQSEKSDSEKLQVDLNLTKSKLIELQQKEPSLIDGNKFFENNDEENKNQIENISELRQFSQRAPSQQSLISGTPGEKQQSIAQNELLSSSSAEKDRELISLQQADKTQDDLIKNLETLRMNLQQMKFDTQVKQMEFNAIRNVLNEKVRENYLLKEEKKDFIEKLAKMERDKQEQPSIVQIACKPSAPFTPTTEDQNLDQVHKNEQYEKLRSKRSTHEPALLIVEKKQSEDENEFYRQKLIQFEKHVQQFVSELERLYTHLLKMKESYINDLIAAEDREKSLRNQLAQLKDYNQKQDEIIQQLKTSGEQTKQILTTELGTLTLSSRCEPPVPHGTF